MEVTAGAPAKMVLLGDYAVLEGARALVLAVDRRANVRIASRADGICNVSAPDLGISEVHARIGEHGRLQWQCDEATRAKLTLVDHVWHAMAQEGLAPISGAGFDLALDTSGFFYVESGVRSKLGLGSSAALTVALASALATYAGHGDVMVDRTQWMRRLLHMHGGWQGGRGSGVDIAASVAGGLIGYQLVGATREPTYEPMSADGLPCLFVWSGHSVSTSDSLQRLARWRETHDVDYAAHMSELASISADAIDAFKQRHMQSFIRLTREYALGLQRFGAACGLEIYSPAQKQLADMVSGTDVSYKPCGAGGDFGVVFAEDAERLVTFERAIVAAGMHVIPLGLDSLGVSCHMRPDATPSPARILT
jgi:phosphomevalonate kinase